METMINQILERNFDYERDSLHFSCTKLELSLSVGKVYKGTFFIRSNTDYLVQGHITTSDIRMECITQEFSGTENEIAYCFHGEKLEEGDVIKGEFYVISNQGEFYLPFIVTIEQTQLSSSIGNIKNLFHFANLARTNWKEAINLFYSPQFKRVFTGNDQRYYDSYRGLSVYPGNQQNVEEFLIVIHKKQKIEYSVSESELYFENPSGMAEAVLEVERNGWGYTYLKVEVEGEFLTIEKEKLTEDDFFKNTSHLSVYVNAENLHRGKYLGKISFIGAYQTISILVSVRIGESRDKTRQLHQEKKRLIVQMMGFYQAFRMRRISTAAWLRETSKLVKFMVDMDERDIAARLFEVQIFITQERIQEAESILNQTKEELGKDASYKQPVLMAYYLYLTTLIHYEKEYVDAITDKVEQLYEKNPTSWQIAWLLIYLSQEYSSSAVNRWVFIERQFLRGSRSPVLYMEALAILNNSPSILRKLDDFELQVLLYGAKEGQLCAELTEQILYLSSRKKEYSNTLYRILKACYQKKKDVRILQEICTLLIKGHKVQKKYFEWYQKGVEKGLRITNLYEYFMMSLDLTKEYPLPKPILFYFSYQNSMDYERSAYLYRYILMHSEEFPELYQNYKEQIEKFVLEQIQKGHINRYLAYLYQEVLTLTMIEEQNAKPLIKILFTYFIQVKQEGMYRVIVYQSGNLQEMVYPLVDGKCFLPLYGNDSTILMEDLEGRRFVKSIDYTTERLMLPGRYLRKAAGFVQDNLFLDLYLCDNSRGYGEGLEDYAERCLRLARSSDISLTIKQELCPKIIHRLYEKDDMRQLDIYLQEIEAEKLTAKERREVLFMLVLRGWYDKAYEWICNYGPYFADAKTLMRLVSEVVYQTEYVEDKKLTAAMICVFHKGKYNGNILRYLAMHFQGMTKEMRDIWKAASSFGIDCFKLCERILVQMLYTGSFIGEKMEIFQYYSSKGGKPEIEEAFLFQCCYDYFVKEKLIESYIFEEISNRYQHKESLPKVCRLAYLKYYAENPKEASEEKQAAAKQFLTEFLQEGIHLNFFRAYSFFDFLLFALQDKIIIEYHAHPKACVKIHYILLGEKETSGEYQTMEMRPVYGGICFQEFILFFGESIQYYISEEQGGQEKLTESGILQREDSIEEVQNGRYAMINDIVISENMQDYNTMDSLVEEYFYKEFMNQQLFEIQKETTNIKTDIG